MDFIEFVAVIKRHKSLVRAGLVAAVLIAIFSSYRLDGSRLVSRSQPVYETTAVVAIKPGAEIPTLAAATPADVTPTTTVAPIGSVPVPVDTSAAATAPPTSAPGAATLDDFIDSRGLYYSALSIQTAVVAPGFAERVHDSLPTMDGSIDAVVPLDTNTIRLVVDASSPSRATATMQAALEQLQPMVDSYATSGAFRFTLEAEVISGPSTPTSVSSIKGPLTVTVVFAVAIVLLWLGLRAYDLLQLHGLGSDHSSRIPQIRTGSSGDEPDVDEAVSVVPSEPEPDVDEAASVVPSEPEAEADEEMSVVPSEPEPEADEEMSVVASESEPEAEQKTVASSDSDTSVWEEMPGSSDSEATVREEVPASSDHDTSVREMPASSESDTSVGEPVVTRVSTRSGRKPRRLVTRDFEDEAPSASPR